MYVLRHGRLNQKGSTNTLAPRKLKRESGLCKRFPPVVPAPPTRERNSNLSEKEDVRNEEHLTAF